MGAIHSLDLTKNVTHLIVGDATTAKYQYVARQRPDIKVLRDTWIGAVRESWMAGVDVDVPALEKEHRLPTFYGLRICVTGFDDLEQRNYISSTIEKEGAEYHGDLTRAVSHLIAAVPQGAKYTHGKQWGIRVVSLRWFQDSLKRGMILDERFYDPAVPFDEKNAPFQRNTTALSMSSHKRPRESDAQTDASRKKLRRSASSRLESQSQDMWHDISSRDGTHERAERDQWKEDDHNGRTLESAVNRRSNTSAELEQGSITEHHEEPRGLFAGFHILIYGFDKKKAALLHKVLEQNGATMRQSSEDLDQASRQPYFKTNYLLVPHTLFGRSSPKPAVPPGTNIATEWWVERCIHFKQ